MLYNTFLLSVTAFMLWLSVFLVYRARNLENDFRKLQRDITLQLKQPRSEGFSNGRMAKMAKTREDIESSPFQKTEKDSLKLSFRRVKREQGGCRAPPSFLQLSANTNKQPYVRGNVTVIPWSVAVQRGHAISPKENKIVVQEDGYYMVFGQVLFERQDNIMGHIVRSWSSTISGRRSIELLQCIRDTTQIQIPQTTCDNTCYTAGIMKLHREDELELVIPHRPHALISVHAESTFFGIMQLN
ncbi:tumor necrosis factor ligand superfamily member 13B-like [Polymixia lowei]